jgi:hypothetical protein
LRTLSRTRRWLIEPIVFGFAFVGATFLLDGWAALRPAQCCAPADWERLQALMASGAFLAACGLAFGRIVLTPVWRRLTRSPAGPAEPPTR